MPTRAVSQMNIRMDTQLKDTGDKVLAEGNTTPTQLVRPSPCANASKLEAIQRGRGLFVQGLATWGIPESAVVAHEEGTDTERYAEELIDRMQGRDVW